ncbi:transglutaminase N-terminal domain-containing protein, partial [Pseudomonas aeruginosa]|nr:transglutaminase family protein [Pseudomonas aeruginosa]
MSAPALRSVPLQGARYQVLHDTHYRYATPVSLSRQLAHLWPRECAWQACHERELLIEPGPSRREDGHDAFGNPLSRLAFERPHEALRVSARLQVEVFAHAPAQL